jgi:hypothetical protein
MARTWGRLSFLFTRASLFLGVKAFLTIIVLAYAATLVTTPHTYQALTGGSLKVTNNLGAVDKGFTTATLGSSVTGTCPSANVTFGVAPGTANTAILANDYVYDVQVSTTAASPVRSCFTATLVLTPASGTPTTYGPVSMATGASVSAGQTIDCKFDVGASLPQSPFSFKVTVQ